MAPRSFAFRALVISTSRALRRRRAGGAGMGRASIGINVFMKSWLLFAGSEWKKRWSTQRIKEIPRVMRAKNLEKRREQMASIMEHQMFSILRKIIQEKHTY